MEIILIPFLAVMVITTVILVLKYPAGGAALILFFANLEGMIGFAGNTPTKFITIFCVLILLIRESLTHKGLRFDRTAILIALFICWSFVATLWSPIQESSLNKWLSFSLQSMLYFILINLVLSKDDLKIVLWGNIIGGAILAVLITNAAVSSNFLRKGTYAGLGINLAARLTAINVLLSILLYQLEKHWTSRLILIVSIVISGLAVVMALSRGAWYGVSLSLLTIAVIFILRKDFHLSKIKILTGVIAILFSVYFLANRFISEHGTEKLTYRLNSSIDFEDGASHRFQIWGIGWEMFLDAPFLGHGFDSFSYLFPNYLSNSKFLDAFSVMENKEPHNAFMSVLTNLGLIGLILFLLIWSSVFRDIWSRYRDRQSKTGAVAWGMGLFVFLTMSSTVDTSIERKYFWYMLALIVLILRYYQNEIVGQSEEYFSEKITVPLSRREQFLKNKHKSNRSLVRKTESSEITTESQTNNQ